jgi:pilus assembly protein CpaF
MAMSSFLSRRITEQAKREAEERASKDAAYQGFHEELLEDDPAPAAPVEAQAAQEDTSAVLGEDGPAKRRTSPKVAQLRKQFRAKLLASLDEADQWSRGDHEREQLLIGRLKTILQKANVQLSPAEFQELQEAVLNDLMGFGAIEPLVQSKAISEIMVNGADLIFAEQKGKLAETEIVFDDEEHVQWTAQRIVRPLQRALNRANPMVDARLPDGSRVHVVMPPSAINGTTITIRKFPAKPLTVDDLIRFGSFTKDVAEFLRACIVSRLNVIVSGGTGSGKTTLLNVLSSYIPDEERIVTIEDAAELQLTQRHVVSLETAPPIPGGDGIVGRLTVRDLVKGALRMRPDRIVVGECRAGEALDMLQAMNTGHDGSLTTIHSNSPRDCMSRLETLVLMAGMDLPLPVIRRQVAGAVNLIIQQSRLKDGTRKIVQITELQGMEGDQITLQDLFMYRSPGQTGQGYSHAGGGQLEPTGYRPNFIDQLEEFGFNLSNRIFGAGQKFNK